jgi:DMSO/TMAO reductase YedYZ molybdopterin-dependent catalytic subunit
VRDDVGVGNLPRRWHALAGAVAALAGIAVSHLLTNVLNSRATPVQTVAEAIIEITPGPVAETLIQLVGTRDKPILIGGVTLAILGLGALAGVLARRSRRAAYAVFGAMAVVALAALMTRPGFSSPALLPLGAGVATWFIVLAALVDLVPALGTEDDETGVGADGRRRRFLLAVGGVVAGSAVVAAGGRFFGRSRRAVETARRLLRLPVRRGVVPPEARLEVPGTSPWRVPNSTFYRIDTALVLPTVDPAEWRLRIHGMVEREMVLTFEDLLARKLSEAWVTLCCVSNPVGGDLIGNAWWSGVRVADLLAEAGVLPDADAVRQTSEDGWNCGTPLEALTDDRNALVAVAMNGEPLPVDHGFPARMVVPGLYGYVSATKWLVDLEVTRFDRFEAYWTERGWSEKGPVKTQSRVEAPRDGADVPAGSVRIGGHAWAQHTGVEKVEYRLDGNAWAEAELGGVPNLDTWVQWAATVDVEPGDHTVAVRATDRSGYTQTSAVADVVPDGATGWHTIDFTAG